MPDRRTIVDKGVRIPSDTAIGYDADEDRDRGIVVTEEGIRVVSPEVRFEQP